MSVQPQQMLKQWQDMNDKLQKQIDKQAEFMDKHDELIKNQSGITEKLDDIITILTQNSEGDNDDIEEGEE